MYAVNDCVCSIDIIVLMPEERYKGHGNVIIKDVLAQDPQIRTIILDVQQRNTSAVSFYRKPGFHTVTEEPQNVARTPVMYYKCGWTDNSASVGQ